LTSAITAACRRMRVTAIRCGMKAAAMDDGAHFGPGLSCMEITATLYLGVLRHDPARPTWEGRDRFILSKGHGVLGYYTALAEAGTSRTTSGRQIRQRSGAALWTPVPDPSMDRGFDRLGHGLPIAGDRPRSEADGRADTYVLVGDGEQRGSIWRCVCLSTS
jgi:transketolase